MGLNLRKEPCDYCVLEGDNTSKWIFKRLPGRRLCKKHNDARLNNLRGEKIKKPIKKKFKATGEKAIFDQIALERPHISFVSGLTIANLSVKNFAHVLGKGVFPRFRLYKKNIVLLTGDEHFLWDHTPHSKLPKEFDKLKKLEQELKEEYYS